MLSDLHHVGIAVANIERSIRFYRGVLGMVLMRRRSTDADYLG
jgi:catechol 2,3-dioxygenase-like lactoylglutathione lyase family enzyme